MSQRSIYSSLALLILLLVGKGVCAQNSSLDSFRVLQNGDTFNKVDGNGIRWGQWFEDYQSDKKYFYTIGEYYAGRKQGVWQVYDTSDELIERSNYRNGVRHGRSSYFSNGQVSSTGEYIGFYSSLRDTFMVEDPRVDTLTEIITDLPSYSFKNGPWYYLNEYTGDTTRIENYHYGDLVSSVDLAPAIDEEVLESIRKKLPHNKVKPLQIKQKPRKPYFPTQ